MKIESRDTRAWNNCERHALEKIAAALKEHCQRAMQDGRPYLVDVEIARRFEGSDSEYYDFFSVAAMQRKA